MSDATSPDPAPPAEVPLRARGWGVPIILAAVSIVAVMVIGAAVASLLGGEDGGETVTFVVPEGTAERGYLGETIDIMPPEVQMRVGDTLVIRNDDTQTATVGPFTVRPGETLQQEFRRPQTLIGDCTLSGTGEIKIIVT